MFSWGSHVGPNTFPHIHKHMQCVNNLLKIIWLFNIHPSFHCAMSSSDGHARAHIHTLQTYRLLVLGGSGKSTRVELTAPAAVIWWLLSLKKGTVWQLHSCRRAWMWWQEMKSNQSLTESRMTEKHWISKLQWYSWLDNPFLHADGPHWNDVDYWGSEELWVEIFHNRCSKKSFAYILRRKHHKKKILPYTTWEPWVWK